MCPPDLPVPLAFATFDWIIVAGYVVGVLLLGAWFGRRRSGDDADYFLAGRSMPTWAVMLSLLATSLSAATFIGGPNSSYGGDLTFLILYLGNFVAVFVVAFIFVPRLYATGTTTIYGYLGRRYGPHAQRAAGLTFVCGRLLASGARLFMAATPLWLLLFAGDRSLADSRGELALCVVAVGLVGTIYTLMGGIRAVMWTDTIQFGLIVIAVAAVTVVAYDKVDLSLGELIAKADAAEKLKVVDWSLDLTLPYTVWTALIGNMLFFAAVFGTDHDLAQRFLTAKSARGGMKAVIGSQVIGLVTVTIFLLLGLLLWAYYEQNVAPAQGRPVFVEFMIRELPVGLAGLAVAGLFAAAQSSMDSATNAVAGSLLHDVARPDASNTGPRHGSPPSRLVTLGVGIALTLFGVGCVYAFDPEAPGGFLDFALGVMSYAVTGLMGVFTCAFFTRRGNAASMIAALLVAAAVMVIPRATDVPAHWFWFVPIAIVAGFITCAVGRGRDLGAGSGSNAR